MAQSTGENNKFECVEQRIKNVYSFLYVSTMTTFPHVIHLGEGEGEGEGGGEVIENGTNNASLLCVQTFEMTL